MSAAAALAALDGPEARESHVPLGKEFRRAGEVFQIEVDGDHAAVVGQAAHLLLAYEGLADTAQTKQSDMARPAAHEVIGDLCQSGEFADAIGEEGGCRVETGHVATS